MRSSFTSRADPGLCPAGFPQQQWLQEKIASPHATCLIPLDFVFSSVSHEASGKSEVYIKPSFRKQYFRVFSLT